MLNLLFMLIVYVFVFALPSDGYSIRFYPQSGSLKCTTACQNFLLNYEHPLC